MALVTVSGEGLLFITILLLLILCLIRCATRNQKCFGSIRRRDLSNDSEYVDETEYYADDDSSDQKGRQMRGSRNDETVTSSGPEGIDYDYPSPEVPVSEPTTATTATYSKVNKKGPKKIAKKSNDEQQEMYDNVEMKERVKKPTDAEVEEVVYDTVEQLSSRKNSKSSNTAPAADGTEGSLSIEDSFSSVEGGGYENTTFELDK